jgi:cyclomaltodextrinase / maltogenic alpha-amylase / neopullulanase
VSSASRWHRIARIAVLATACGGGRGGGALRPSESLRQSEAIVIDSADAEVWNFSIDLRGGLVGSGRLTSCRFERNRVAYATRIEEGRSFQGAAQLAPGPNEVRAHCETTAGKSLASPAVVFTVMLPAGPDARPSAVLRGDRLLLDGSSSRPAEYAPAPLARYVWTQRAAGLPAGPERAVGEGPLLALPEPRAPRVYTLRVEDAAGRSDTGAVLLSLALDQPALRAPDDPPPWLASAVVYGVVPPLFGEPAFSSVRRALPGLARLGITALWIAPVFQTPPGDFGYAVTNALAVRADYGDEAELRALVDDAHALGMRVLFDLIPNHTSALHPYFVQAQALGSRSHYYGFYERDAVGRPLHYFDWEHLPNLDFSNSEVQRWAIESAAYWVRRLSIDGYRIDVAWGIQQRAPEFWRPFRDELMRLRPELALIAESSARRWQPGSGFDLAYDWTDEPGHAAFEHVFDDPDQIVQRLHDAVMRTQRSERAFRFLNNNDTGERFITRHGEAITRVATAALLTLPGVPCLYSFDEVGAEYQPYLQRGPIEAPDNRSLRDWHARLIALRHSLPALHGSGFISLAVDGAQQVYAFLRASPGEPEHAAVVLLNFGSRAAHIELSVPDPFRALGSGPLRDLLSQRRHAARHGAIVLDIAAHDAMVLVRAATPTRSRSER